MASVGMLFRTQTILTQSLTKSSYISPSSKLLSVLAFGSLSSETETSSGSLWQYSNDNFHSNSLIIISRLGVPGEPIPVSSEQEIFEIIGMDYKEPTERNL